MRPNRWAFLFLFLAACVYGNDISKEDTGQPEAPPTEEPGIDPPPAGAGAYDPWVLELVSTDNCAATPQGRYGAATATFFTDDPVLIDDRPIRRGFVMMGGRTTSALTSQRMSDLWLFDYDALGACPWIKLSDDPLPGFPSGAPFSDGILVFNESQTLLYMGGYRDINSATETMGDIYRLSLSDLDTGTFTLDVGSLGSFESWFRSYSDEACQNAGNIFSYCYDPDTCAFDKDVFHEPCSAAPLDDCCSYDEYGNLEGCLALSVEVSPCETDPACTGLTLLNDGPDLYGLDYRPFVGLAQAAGAWTGSSTRVFGGSNGCVDCGSLVHLSMYNSDVVLDVVNTGFNYLVTDRSPWPSQDFGFSAWPDDATLGARGWSAAELGQEWSHASQGFNNAPTGFALVGATTWQSRSPDWGLVVEEDTGICGHTYNGIASATSIEPGELLGDGIPNLPLVFVNNAPGAQLFLEAAPGLPALAQSTIASFGPGSVLVAGGGQIAPFYGNLVSGSEERWIYHALADSGFASSAIAWTSDGLATAPIEVDPHHLQAYVVDHQGRTFRIRHESLGRVPPTFSDPSYAFNYTVSLGDQQTLQGGSVRIETLITAEVQCGDLPLLPNMEWAGDVSDRCFADHLALEIYDPYDDEQAFRDQLADASILVQGKRNGVAEPMRLWPVADSLATSAETPFYDTGRAHRSRRFQVRLPYTLVDGDELQISVELVRDVNDDTGRLSDISAYGDPGYFEFGTRAPAEGSCDPRRDGISDGIKIKGTPVVLVDAVTEIDGLPGVQSPGLGADPNRIVQVVGVRGDINAVDTSYTFVAGGVDASCAASGLDAFFYPLGDACIAVDRPHDIQSPTTLVLHNVEAQGVSIGGQIEVYADRCLDPLLLGDLVDRTATHDDLTWLTDRLGAWPLGPTSVVFLRDEQPSWGGVNGLTSAGLFTITDESTTEITLIHELAHAWFGYAFSSRSLGVAPGLQGSTQWFKEAYPTLLMEMRHPTHTALPDGAESWALSLQGIEGHDIHNVELNFAGTLEAYHMSAYLAAQLHHTLRAAGGDDAAVWASLAAELTDPSVHGVLRPLFPNDLEPLFTILGAPSFYSEWVAGGLDANAEPLWFGPPQLGIARVDHQGTSLNVVVRSVLPDFHPTITAPHSAVPFYLGCADPTDPSNPSVFSCDLAVDVMGTPLPHTIDSTPGAEHTVTVTRSDGAEIGPVLLALFAGDRLLPEHVSSYAVRDGATPVNGAPYAGAATWLLYCQDGDYSAPGCVGIDGDGDGYPDTADCDAALDTDGDWLPDRSELGLDPTILDPLALALDPNQPDSDGGGAWDGDELLALHNPLDPDDDFSVPGMDSDTDGLTDPFEIAVFLDPFNPDTDNGGEWDMVEIFAGRDPFDGSDDAIATDNPRFLADDTPDLGIDINCDGWPMPASVEAYRGY